MAPRPLAPGAGLDAARWAEQELGDAPLGDVRPGRRLVRSAQVQAQDPQASFPGAAQSDRALVKGYHRLMDRPDDTQVTPRHILALHRARTLQRMQQAGRVLCVLDGTALNFAEHPGCAGLGLIGRNRASEGTRGLHRHSLLVLPELELEGRVVFIDAMGCRTDVARTIAAAGGWYLLAVKDNESYLHDHLQRDFAYLDRTGTAAHDRCETVEWGHGRTERRTCTIMGGANGILDESDPTVAGPSWAAPCAWWPNGPCAAAPRATTSPTCP